MFSICGATHRSENVLELLGVILKHSPPVNQLRNARTFSKTSIALHAIPPSQHGSMAILTHVELTYCDAGCVWTVFILFVHLDLHICQSTYGGHPELCIPLIGIRGPFQPELDRSTLHVLCADNFNLPCKLILSLQAHACTLERKDTEMLRHARIADITTIPTTLYFPLSRSMSRGGNYWVAYPSRSRKKVQHPFVQLRTVQRSTSVNPVNIIIEVL